MNNRDILNVEEEIKSFMDDTNEHDLKVLIEEFQERHYTNVLSKAKAFRDTYVDNEALIHTLLKVSAISHAEIQEYRQAKEIISDLYFGGVYTSIEELIMLGELAFMCDYKLARRIMSAVIEKAETEQSVNEDVISGVYLILGETEENLNKPKRALKYYKSGLDLLSGQNEDEDYIKVFLSFKIGMLHTAEQEQGTALEYLKRSLEYAEGTLPQLKINSLIAIGQIYGSIDKGDEGYPYLVEALEMLPESELKNSPAHMEALLEVGYYHYKQGEYEKGANVYEDAVQVSKALNTPPRKLGMMYMQYAFCLANQNEANNRLASTFFEKAIDQLENENDTELLHSALTDVIAFFEEVGNRSKREFYEKRMLTLAEEANR